MPRRKKVLVIEHHEGQISYAIDWAGRLEF